MSSQALGARVVPTAVFGRHARYVLERNLYVYRHIWMILFSGFFEPLFYLFAARVGLGQIVGGGIEISPGIFVDYATFVAPALLAASAMNGAVYESTMNIYFKLRFAKTYDAMLATPLRPFDVALGEIGWSLLRGALYAIGFMLVILFAGLIESPWAVLALPAALLIGFAFAAMGMAATTYMRSWQDFDIVNLAVLVLFLFSGTFFPISVYPSGLQFFAQFSPLYHGIVLIRALTLGTMEVALIGHTLFLAIMGGVGLKIAGRRLKLLLTP